MKKFQIFENFIKNPFSPTTPANHPHPRLPKINGGLFLALFLPCQVVVKKQGSF